MSAAAALLETLQEQGISLSRDRNNKLMVRPSSKLNDDLRQQLRGLREEIDALIPPMERIEDHLPIDVQRPCVSPRAYGDSRCAAFTQEELKGSPTVFLARLKKSRRPCCGDCDLAHTARRLQLREEVRREKERRRQAQEEINLKYGVAAASHEVYDYEEPEAGADIETEIYEEDLAVDDEEEGSEGEEN